MHKGCMAWIDPPKVTTRSWRRGKKRSFLARLRGCGPTGPEGTCWTVPSNWRILHPALRKQRWQTWRIKDGEKGPIVWQVKHVSVIVPDSQGLPGKHVSLELVCRNPLTARDQHTSSQRCRWDTRQDAIAGRMPALGMLSRCFLEDQKGEVGLDHWEWPGAGSG